MAVPVRKGCFPAAAIPRRGKALSVPLRPQSRPSVNEQELKFHVPQQMAEPFRQWLGMTLLPHRSHGETTVCSIYFDTPEGVSFLEKAASDYRKTKYRVRWYADAAGRPMAVPAFIEVKEKHGAIRRKFRNALPMTGAELAGMSFSEPGFTGLFQRHLPDGAEAPPANLRPVLELRYLRRRYHHPIFPDSFCLDENIRCVRTNPAAIPSGGGRVLGHGVFEQKGPSREPVPQLQALPRFGARRAALSKYFLIMLQLLPHSRHS